MASQQDELYLDMIATLEGHLSKFFKPQLADLGWTKPKMVKVRGLEVSEQELRDLIKLYEASLSPEAYKELRGAKKPSRLVDVPATIKKIGDVVSNFVQGGAPNPGDSQFLQPLTNKVTGPTAPATTVPVETNQGDMAAAPKQSGITPGVFQINYAQTVDQKNVTWMPSQPRGEYEQPIDYTGIGLIEGDNLIKDLNKKVARINGDIDSGYKTVNVAGTPNRISLAFGSEAYVMAVHDRDVMLKQIDDISKAMSETAKTYKPLPGPQTDVVKRENELAAKYKTYKPQATVTAPQTTTGATTTGTTTTTPKFQPPLAVRGRTETVTPPLPGGTVTPTTTTPSASSGPKSDQASWISNQLTLRNLQDTPKNRKDLAAEYRKSKFTPLGDNWVEEFKAKFPTLGFIFDNPEFGPEVLAIAKEAYEQNWFLYPEAAQTLINQRIAQTPYGQRSSAKQEAFDKKSQADQQVDIAQKVGELQKTYGKLELSEAEWQQIGYTAARNGLDDTLTQQKMLEFVYQKTPEGAYRYDSAVKAVEAGRLGQEVRKVYGDYFVNADEDAIKNYATGATTLEDIRRQSRELAKYLYPALTPMLDQGLTVKNIADQYANIAAETLELPANTINMMDPKYRVAFDVREGDKSRTMTIGEFQTKLKTDPTYGWQYTKSANQQSMDLATTIARAFGKVQ